MLSLRAARSLTALTAIAGVTGLSLLPLDHMHREHRHDSAHHSVTVHRHTSSHHHASVDHAISGTSIGRATVTASDDEESAPSLQVFFTKGPRAVRYQPVMAESDLYAWFPEPPDGRRLKIFRLRPPPHGPPFDPARPLRAPPVPRVS